MTKQLAIDGIGQQKVTLDDWKKESGIYTHNAEFTENEGMKWSAWNEYESPIEFLSNYHCEDMGFGKTQKEAILEFCRKEQIKPPFWW